ncbi:hypothetical protein J1N35_038171 [Gossypium stocksii]|uniref:RNase H type-1 domain-containing protein n=1 Tax=Gossypium stocksii TaxID=47602 RepID=A0A9D3ZMG5_9ROSI|nr:hypothetical protein J1N35_038171 [Gossypium stocksii]
MAPKMDRLVVDKEAGHVPAMMGEEAGHTIAVMSEQMGHVAAVVCEQMEPVSAAIKINGMVGLSGAKPILNSSFDGPSQANDVVFPSCEPTFQTKDAGGSSNLESDFVFNKLNDARCSDLIPNCSNSTSMNISCFNPIFVGQEVNKGDALILHGHVDPLMSELVDIQVTDASGGLNSQRHTVVSFNEKGSVGGIQIRKNNESNNGNKTRPLGKPIGNKDGSFRTTKKINKIMHGKGINFKSKIFSKIHLSDSISRLAQIVSIMQGVDSEVLGSNFGRNIHSDNIEVVKDLSMEDTVDSSTTLFRRVKRLLCSEGQWEINYVNRECNLIADQLAKFSLSWKSPLQIFETPPELVVKLIEQDNVFSNS